MSGTYSIAKRTRIAISAGWRLTGFNSFKLVCISLDKISQLVSLADDYEMGMN